VAVIWCELLVEPEFAEDLLDVPFDGAFGDEQSLGDGGVRAAFGDESEYLALAGGQVLERIGLSVTAEEPGDDRRIDHGLALG
jgi:hypothetical protein